MNLDEELERLKAAWRDKARYRVFISGWHPAPKRIVIAKGLRFEEARRRAAAEYEALKSRDPKVRGRFGDDLVQFELENKADLDSERTAGLVPEHYATRQG